MKLLFWSFSDFNLIQNRYKILIRSVSKVDVSLAMTIFGRFTSELPWVSKQIFEIFFPLLKSFFLASSF